MSVVARPARNGAPAPVRRGRDGRIVGDMAACEDLDRAPADVAPVPPPDACADCVAEGRRDWVHLRLCLACGHIGCCDSSPRRHATAHYEAEGHPVVRSHEPGENWRWCFTHSVLG
jgi:ubiquitin-hydrolase Zn-finger-containing protein